MSSNNSSHVLYFDKLRILGAFFVVMIHVSAQYWNEACVSSSQWQFMSAYDIIGMSGVPVFFMLSGALMLNPEKEIKLVRLFKRILQFILIYIVWLTFYNLISFVFGDSQTAFNLKDMIYKILLGQGAYHLWFIPELAILYLISPILREIFRSKKICEVYLVIYFFTGIMLPTILLFDFPYKIFVESLYNRTSLPMLTGYIGYFVLGSYLANMCTLKKSTIADILLALGVILGNAVAIAVDGIDAVNKNEPSVILDTPLALPIFISSSCIFLLFKINEKSISERCKKLLSILSALTFGVYLVHPAVIMLLMKLGMNTMKPHSIIMVPIYTFIVFCISSVLVLVIKNIPFIKKLVQ